MSSLSTDLSNIKDVYATQGLTEMMRAHERQAHGMHKGINKLSDVCQKTGVRDSHQNYNRLNQIKSLSIFVYVFDYVYLRIVISKESELRRLS